jgi:hypothetical protein
MHEMDRSVRPAPHVHATVVDGEAVLLDTRTEEFFGLNELATSIWANLMDGKTIQETLSSLEVEYEAETEELRSDLTQFVRTMVEMQIIEYV